MRTTPSTTSIRAARLVALLVVPAALATLHACTDLTETPASSITPGNYFRNEEEVIGGLAAVYAQLRHLVDDYYNLSEISTDEMVVPTRGQDWYDNGIWLETHRQTWQATSPSGLSLINGAWVVPFTGIARANVLLDALPRVSVRNKGVVEAEARALRAYYYFALMDMFGGVPIVTTPAIAARPRSTRAELFNFIETELKAARDSLPVSWPATDNGRMTKGAVDAILASMYLNAAVFTKDQGIDVAGYNSCKDVQVGTGNACQAAIERADSILNSSAGYTLATNWRSNFTYNNDLSPENIFVAKFAPISGLGLNFLIRALHYYQFTPSPWNGFATLSDAYNSFDSTNDQRWQIFLVGPQVNLETGQPVNDRTGARLVFTPEIADITSATEGEGVRIAKWPPDPNHVGPDNGNDFAFFRLAEIYLIKAEAMNELGQTSAAIDLVNQMRARVTSTSISTGLSQTQFRDALLKERLFELTAESKRRQDLIRFGKYTAPFQFKDQREPYRVLMPIPQTQIDANPLLTQNPGY
jgi:hypothetical protein